MESYDTIEYRGFNIKLYHDEDPMNPRERDTFGVMTCFHPTYNLGDKHDFGDVRVMFISLLEEREYQYEVLEKKNMAELGRLFDKHYFSMPLFLFDHGGITMNTTGFSCPWDSGQVGITYVSHVEARKELKIKRLSKKAREKIYRLLRNEVEVFDQYISDAVYGYQVEPSDRTKRVECDDACWGWYGSEGIKQGVTEAKSIIDSAIKAYRDTVRAEHLVRVETARFMRTCWAD